MQSRPAVLASLLLVACAPTPTTTPAPSELRGVLVTPGQVDGAMVQQLRRAGHNTVVLPLWEGVTPAQSRAAAVTVITSGLSLGYWVEVGRSPTLAQAHPEWVAELRGPGAQGRKAKAWPWVPIQGPGAFGAQVQRVAGLLREQIAADVVLLNDLQGAPSACGCGDPLCRTDPTVGGEEAAASFVAEIERLLPRSRVVPVWTSGLRSGGEGCHAECVATSRRQWQALAARSDPVGLLLLGQDPAPHPAEPWIEGSLRGMATDSGPRLVPVLRGWDASDTEVLRQCRRSEAADGAGYVVAWTRIEQGFEARPAEGR